MRLLQWGIQGVSYPANFFVALVRVTNVPTQDTNTLGDLIEITAGNGYTAGGYTLNRDATDWPDLAEDDTGDAGTLKAKDVAWSASGGPIPASGLGARYAVLLGPNATPSLREVLAYWDLAEDRTVSSGQNLTLQDLELDLSQT
jgi:hypothetical protein